MSLQATGPLSLPLQNIVSSPSGGQLPRGTGADVLAGRLNTCSKTQNRVKLYLRVHIWVTLTLDSTDIADIWVTWKPGSLIAVLEVEGFTARRHAAVVVCLSVCLCLSVTSRCSTERAKRRIMQTTPHDSPGTLVFWDAEDLGETLTGLPLTEAPNADEVS